MDLTAQRSDLLDLDLPAPLLGLAAGLLAVLWWSSHGWASPSRSLWRLLVRSALGSVCLWAICQTAGRLVHFATPWPLWTIAVIAALCIEIIAEIYRHERSITGARRGRWVIALRNAAIIGIAIALLEPTHVVEGERQLQRELVILVDESASMELTDKQPSVAEKLDLARLFEVESVTQRGASISDATRALSQVDRRLALEIAALQPPSGISAAAADTLIAKRARPLAEFIAEASRTAVRAAETIAHQRDVAAGTLSESSAQLLSDYDTRIRENIASELTRAANSIAAARYNEARGVLHSVGRQLRYVLDRLPKAAAETDALYLRSLDDTQRADIDRAARHSRKTIAREAMLGGQAVIDSLRSKYRLRVLRYAETAEQIEPESWIESSTAGNELANRGTDLASALDDVLAGSAADDLAGVLVLSDGRHNGDQPAEQSARRLGLKGVPLCAVAVGSETGPRDAAVLDVRAPDAIFLDDQAVIRADLKLDGLAGDTAKVQLMAGDELLSSESVEIQADTLRHTVRFAHTPEALGILDYEVVIEPQAGEAFTNNNRWRFHLAVTDDRTNVLLIDSHPRWEFRYLRNLLYARDKSVHLQHLLLSPDEISGTEPAPVVHASAARKFGDAEATALPVSEDEWLRFDAIILGDIPPGALSADDWASLERAVTERGALLVAIAGPNAMPHTHRDSPLAAILPATITADAPPPVPFRLRPTAVGRTHPILQQSPDPAVNALIWRGLPQLQWRATGLAPKPASEVLAWAEPDKGTLTGSLDAPSVVTDARRADEQANALIITGRHGLGHTVLINFDATWRLRYGVGDVYHHQFWGQMLRWGSGENLRAGDDFTRLGSDRLSYRSGAPVTVLAKLLDQNHQPRVTENSRVTLSKDGQVLQNERLAARASSNGIYEATLNAPTAPGRYRLALEDSDVETEIIVGADQNALEFGELTASPSYLRQLASLTGGAVASPGEAASLLPFFLDPGRVARERREASLWDHFALLIPIWLLLGAEWITRRKAGLP